MDIEFLAGYAQFVVELSVNLSALMQTQRKRETLHVGSKKTSDPNFPENEGLELLMCKEPHESYVTVTDCAHDRGHGTCLDHDPMDDAEAWWWTKWKSRSILKMCYYIYGQGVDDDAAKFVNTYLRRP